MPPSPRSKRGRGSSRTGKPLLLINTKAYSQGTGEGAVRLARIAGRLSRKSRADIFLCVQPSDLQAASRHAACFAQHIDAVNPGSHTGHILPESVRAAGARGTLLNHSERKLTFQEIRDRLKRAGQNSLTSVVCVPFTVMVEKVASMKPDYIAIEPPELIGSGVSVSQAKPYVISRAVELAGKSSTGVRVLCGAGISTSEDVAKSLELGTSGVLVASGIVKAPKPEKALREILKGFG